MTPEQLAAIAAAKAKLVAAPAMTPAQQAAIDAARARMATPIAAAPQGKPEPVADAGMVDPGKIEAVATTPPRVEDQAAGKVARDAAELAAFEKVNPALAGKYKAGALPKPGSSVVDPRGGGGGKSGAPRLTVVDWTGKEGSFGDTAMAMMEGPLQAAGQFGGGLLDQSQSPSMKWMQANGVPSMMQRPGAALGDLGMAGLSLVGAGISGGSGLAAEFVPGQNAAQEQKFAGDVVDMSQFAVPELAGGSSVATRAASAAPRAIPKAGQVSNLSTAVSAAEKLGIPVMRTDVKPPSTFIGKVAQKTGESIPLAGTGGVRAKQNEARIAAAQNFVREYGGDAIAPAVDDVTSAMLAKREGDLSRLTSQKNTVIKRASDKGPVPVPKATAAIDAQIAKLEAQKLDGLQPVIAKLKDFRNSIADQSLTEIEANRKVIGEAFSGLDMGAIRSTGEKALSAVYGPLRDDMGEFIKTVGGVADFRKWKAANAKLSEMAGELSDATFKRVLSKGEATPEAVRSMLFSAKPSDVRRLAAALPEQGKASARTAIVQEAFKRAGNDIENLSPERFKTALEKLSSPIGVFFDGPQLDAALGLQKALKLTERASVAGVAPLTGVQNVPAITAVLLNSLLGGSATATAATLGTIGGIARVYEATGVQGALRRLAKTQAGTSSERAAIKRLGDALKKAGVSAAPAVVPAAGQAASQDYEALWDRY